MRKLSSLALIILAGCSTPSSVAPLSVSLAYKTMAERGEFPTLPPCAALSAIQVEDGRLDKTIGKRFVEGKDAAEAAPVTTNSDVSAWVRAGVENTLKVAGVPAGKAGAPVLRIRIEQVSTSENVLHRSGYEGRILLSGELASEGRPSCWKDRADSQSANYGYAGSAENYQETLNHALDRALIRLISAPDFKRSICSCGGS